MCSTESLAVMTGYPDGDWASSVAGKGRHQTHGGKVRQPAR